MRTFKLAARLAVAMIAATMLVSSVAAPARAQQPSANAVALARELIMIKGGGALYATVIRGVIEQAKGVFLQSNPMLQKDLNEVAAALLAELSAKKEGELVTEVARLYAEHFTEQELKEILAFYRTPVGKKMLADEPKVIDQSMSLAQDWANKFSEQVLARFRSDMKKRGHDI